MKNEQEQIEEMAHIMCKYYNSGFCANSDMTEICEDMPDCCYKNEAEALYNAGYGDVSEYKAEIERLKAEYEELQTNAEILASGVRDLNHENYELTEKVKQAQIDILNKLKEKCKFDGHTVAVYKNDIDELIKEVQNAEDKG